MTASEIESNYKQLWKIEDAFGEIKVTLKTRPMFHWTNKRIIGHLVLCFYLSLCEADLTKALRESNPMLKKKSVDSKAVRQRPLTVVQAMDELCRVMAIPIKAKGQTVWVRTDIPPNAQRPMKAIGMINPQKM